MQTNDIVLTIVVITFVILLLIAGVIITMIIANKKHVQQEVKMTQMQLDYEKELRVVENEVQEETLSNVARELHDNIGQLLTLIRIQLEQESFDDQELADKLAPADSTLNDTIEQVRLLSHSLNTDHIAQSGFIALIDKEVNRLSSLKRLRFNWDKPNTEPDINKDKRIMLFRIFQEIVNNAMKHAGAKNITIIIRSINPLVITIKDDGIGFDLEEINKKGRGSGFTNMNKRAELANFKLEIESNKGKGSIFTLSQF
ncbi:MAG: ATP-binding protein [Flavipsychrobacter sp.]